MTISGKQAELKAVQYLRQQGFQIITQNFQYYSKGRGRRGEIDIIAVKDNILHIVEVKARNNQKFGSPLSQISHQKIILLKKSTEFFLYKHPRYQDRPVQFDVITVYQGEINYYPRAF